MAGARRRAGDCRDGARLAFDAGQGRTAVPVRSALLGLVMSVAVVAAAFTFGATLLHLVHTPRLYGKNWDVAVDLQFSTIRPQRFDSITARVPGISAGRSAFTARCRLALARTRPSFPRSGWPQAGDR